MEALLFLTEKRDQTIKGRMVYNGKPTREWLLREDSASPIAALESIMLTAVIDAYKECNIMTVDIPNAFIQTPHTGSKVIMKVKGQLAVILVKTCPELYKDYLVYENGVPVIYLEVLKALYEMLESS